MWDGGGGGGAVGVESHLNLSILALKLSYSFNRISKPFFFPKNVHLYIFFIFVIWLLLKIFDLFFNLVPMNAVVMKKVEDGRHDTSPRELESLTSSSEGKLLCLTLSSELGLILE